jgi:CheY-like chemotaxis protein
MHTVLIIEDDKLQRMQTMRILSKAGYRAISAVDGGEGLRLATEGGIDLILLDMMMPRVGGLETLLALKNDPRTAHVPVVVVTGLSQRNEEKLRKDGAAGFIEKDALLAQNSLLLDYIQPFLVRPAIRSEKSSIAS